MKLPFFRFCNMDCSEQQLCFFHLYLHVVIHHIANIVQRSHLFLIAFTGCIGCEKNDEPTLPVPDPQDFSEHVGPTLLRDCGFSTCHGNPDRLFHIYGPGHIRLDADMELYDPLSERELEVSYHRTKATLLYQSFIEDSLLLSKPIEGAGHKGTDAWGRNVYSSSNDPNYAILVAWAKGERFP